MATCEPGRSRGGGSRSVPRSVEGSSLPLGGWRPRPVRRRAVRLDKGGYRADHAGSRVGRPHPTIWA